MLVNILQVTYLLGLIVVLLVGTGLARLEFLFYGGHHNGRQYLRDLGAAILVSLLWPLALLFVPGLDGPQVDQLIGYMADHWKYTGHGRECTDHVALEHDLYVDYDTIKQEANSVQDPPDPEDTSTEPKKAKKSGKEPLYHL